MRALKQQGSAAGRLINDHEAALRQAPDTSAPMRTVERTVPIDWTDYNGHMNESRYGQVFSDAADAFMIAVGADADYIAAGHSFFTAETTVKYLNETHAGQKITVESRVVLADGKKVKLAHQMLDASGQLLASCEQFMLHVSLTTRKSCPPLAGVEAKITALAAAHKEDIR